MRLRLPALLCLLSIAWLAAGCTSPPEAELAGEWRRFRGPDGLGITAQEGLPVRWGPDSQNIRWRAAVPGSGNSSPIVTGGRIFLTVVYGRPEDGWRRSKDRRSPSRVVLAYDLATGEKLWETVLYRGPRGSYHWSNTHATPTPVTDGEHLFVTFDGHLAKLDLDGNVVWHEEVDPDYLKYSHYGASSSPVLAGEAVILLQDREDGESDDPGWIAAFAKEDGRQIWRDEWLHTCCSYSTPIVVERAGRLEVWSQTALEVNGYDAGSGEKLWSAEHPASQTVPSLVRLGDLFSTPGGMHTRSINMFRLSETDGDASPEALWASKRGVPEISSPVLYRGRIFSVTKDGVLFIRDAETGDVVGKRRLPHGEYRPSLVAGDGKVYVMNEDGLTVVLDADADPPGVLARNRLRSGSGASPAIVERSLIIRTQAGLVRIDGALPKPQKAAPEAKAEPSAEPAAAS